MGGNCLKFSLKFSLKFNLKFSLKFARSLSYMNTRFLRFFLCITSVTFM